MIDNDSVGPRPGVDGPSRAEIVWRRARWFLLRAGAVLGSFVLLMALLTGAAGWYTSRSEFCRSCHIMEPYYKSWQESSHRDVACIKCHFPPGVGEEVRGKMLGLVQLAKYVTASEGPRPAAEVPDASCLRSGCHDTRLLSGRVEFHGVPFDHTPHIENVRRGKQLRCTSCHSQIVQGQHMSVTPTTCFLCHFKEQGFNEGLGACTRCHQIPQTAFDLGGGVKFTHDLAYERGVDCANCHGDLVRGQGEVPRERCMVCHNRENDLKQIGDHVFIHEKHVTDHNVDCLDCHLTIEHSVDPHRIENAAADCKACHPNHHQEQVNMLRGTGGKLVPTQPSEMSSVRIACPTCHQLKQVSPTGTVLWKASIQMCTNCHDAKDAQRLQAYHEALRASLPEIEAGVLRVGKALESAKLEPARAEEAAKELKAVQDDWHFLRVANDIHNIHYASTLTHALVDRLSSLCRELKVEEPKVALPKMEKPSKEGPGKK